MTLEIRFLDVGQGDGTLIILPDGKLGVVDAAQSSNGANPVLDAILAHESTLGEPADLAFICLTHPHEDHFSGLATILTTLGAEKIRTYAESGIDLEFVRDVLFRGEPHIKAKVQDLKDALAPFIGKPERHLLLFRNTTLWQDNNNDLRVVRSLQGKPPRGGREQHGGCDGSVSSARRWSGGDLVGTQVWPPAPRDHSAARTK